jgi:protein-disulfide isomerase
LIFKVNVKVLLRGMNKKTYILGFGAILVLAGIVWYANWGKQPVDNQTASITDATSDSPVELTDEFILGDKDAPVDIIEYSSHLCGYCAKFHSETLPLIIDKYVKEGQVKFVHRIVSPSILGIAVLCAGDQKGFWEFDEYLFEHINEILEQINQASSAEEAETMVVDSLKKAAGDLELNQDKFNQCFDSGEHEEVVRGWFLKSNEDGVEGTPTFLINGQKVVGALTYDSFEKIIEEKLNN